MIFFYLLISVMPLSSHPLWGKLVGELTVVKYLGGACLLFATAHMLGSQRLPRLASSPQTRWFLLLAAWTSVSFVLNGDLQNWQLSPFASYLSFVLLLFLTTVFIDSFERLRNVLLVSVASVALASLYIVREWQRVHLLYAEYRPGSVTGDPNYFSISALVCLPLAFCLGVGSRSLLVRAFCLGSLLVTLAALTLAASRGGLLGLLTAMLYLALRSRRPLRGLVLLLVIAVPVGLFSRATPLRRLLNPNYSDRQSTDSRLTLWRAGLRMVADSPLFGIGLGRYKSVVMQYESSGEDVTKIAHNSYVELAAEAGIPALIAFLAILIYAFRSLERVRRAALSRGLNMLRDSALGLQAGLAACAVSLFFVSGQYQKLLWLVVFLSAAMTALAAQRLRPVPPAREMRLLQEVRL